MDDERTADEVGLDEALGGVVIDNRQAHRFELTVEGQMSVLTYERQPKALVLIHTEVPPGLRGHHLADRLAQAALDAAHADRLQVVAVCPFVRAYLQRHPQAAS